MTSPIWQAVEAARRSRAGAPVLAEVGPHTRSELSAISLENAVAKAANALLDPLDIEPGAVVAIDLPVHWQRSVWTLAAWTVGAVVCPGSPVGAEMLITHADAVPHDASTRIGLVSLHPLGLSDRVVAGTENLGDLARLSPDVLLAPEVAGSMPALVGVTGAHGAPLTQQQLTQQQCLDHAAARLNRGGRVLLVPDELADVDAWVLPALGPLLPDVSVVVVRGMTDLDSVIRSERITWSLPGQPGV